MSVAPAPSPAPVAPWHRLELACDAGTLQRVRSAVEGGVALGTGRLAGRPVVVWAQDGAQRGGALGAQAGATLVRAYELAERMRAPVVGFPHSGGARIDEGAGALAAYAAIFRAQATARVAQLSVVCGPCAGGAAYAPALGDLTIMVAGAAQLFLTGPRVVEQVTREQVTPQELGGARVHERTGVAHLVARDEVHAADLARAALAHLPTAAGEPLPSAPPAPTQPGDPSAAVPADARRVYDVRAVLARLADRGDLLELAPRWARNLVCGLARLDGAPLGVLASQPRHLGGTLDAAAAEKGAWFVGFCERFGLPLLVLVDTPGFLPGTRQEGAGVIRHGASFLRAFARARIPRVTLTLRQAYGGAHIVMNSRNLGADLTLAWPDARVGVMGARQAVEILGRGTAAAYESAHLPVRRAAAGGHVDEVVEPLATRERLIAAFGGLA